MNPMRSSVLSPIIIVVLLAGAPVTPLAAELQSRSVAPEVEVHNPDLQVRDVTQFYRTGERRASRASGEYFITVAGTAPLDEFPLQTILTSDQGAVTVGSQYDNTPDGYDALIVKYDNTGSISWARAVGGVGAVDHFRGVVETPDNGYVCAGYSNSYSSGEVQIFVAKFDSSGALQWARTAGGGATDAAEGVCLNDDGTIFVGGMTSSFGASNPAVLLLGFDLNGTLLWATMGDAGSNDRLFALSPTSDGGCVGAGWSSSFSTWLQALIVKFDSDGNISWSSVVGDDCWNCGYDVAETPDGGYLLTGNVTCYDDLSAYDVLIARFGPDGTLWWSRSLGNHGTAESGWTVAVDNDGNFAIGGVTTLGYGQTADAFLLCFDSNGGLQWARTVGGDQDDYCNHLLLTSNGGFLLSCVTESFGAGGKEIMLAALNSDGIVPGCPYTRTWYISSPLRQPPWSAVSLTETHPSPTVSVITPTPVHPSLLEETVCDYASVDTEYWLVGSGSDDTDRGRAIGQTPDEGYLVVGETYVSAGNEDVLLLKYDALGNLQWARTAGGPYNDNGHDLLVTEDGGCIVVGDTYSYGAGGKDVLLLGFDPGGTLLWASTVGGDDNEIAWSIWPRSDGSYQVCGGSNSFGMGDSDILLLEVNPEGSVLAAHTIGTFETHEEATRGIPLTGGGSLLTGFNHAAPSAQQALAVKVADDGSYVWNSVTGSGDHEAYRGAVELPGGDLLLGGFTYSYGTQDLMLVRLAASGARQWFRTVGTADDEDLFDLKFSANGGVVCCGWITQAGGDYQDALLAEFDDEGQTLWARRVGGDTSEHFYSLLVTGDGELAAAGFTSSFGLVSGDAFVTHTDGQGMVTNCPWFDDVTLTTADQFPPAGGYAMTSMAISPSVGNPTLGQSTLTLDHVLLCSALPPTVSAVVTALPSSGTIPFSTWMEASLTNTYAEQIRRMAARIHVTLGNGAYYPNWRVGFTNIGPGETYSTGWSQNIPALGSVIGENHFRLVAEDVTPSPYNQPPYPPSGDTDTHLQTVVAYSP